MSGEEEDELDISRLRLALDLWTSYRQSGLFHYMSL